MVEAVVLQTEEDKEGSRAETCGKLVKNLHCVLTVIQYLSRKQKYALTGLCRAFREHIVFKSFVSAKFVGHDVITKSTLLTSIVNKSRKLTKFEIEEVIIDLQYVSVLEKAFMIN